MRVCASRQSSYVFSLYHNIDLDDQIFYCLQASMAAMQPEDIHASFLFVGDFNGHHLEWLGSSTLSGCDRSVVGSTHACGGTLDLQMTDVPDLVWVAVVAPIGNSDHSSLSAVISISHTIPNLCVSRKVFLKHQVNLNTVCGAIQDLPWHNIWLADNPVEALNEHLSLLVGCYVPTKVIHVHNKDKPWFDDQCRHAFGLKQEAHLWWTHDCSRVKGRVLAEDICLYYTFLCNYA